VETEVERAPARVRASVLVDVFETMLRVGRAGQAASSTWAARRGVPAVLHPHLRDGMALTLSGGRSAVR
jgi:hypothetical protein